MSLSSESSMVNETLVDNRSRALNGSPIDQRLIEDQHIIEHAGAKRSVMGWLLGTLILIAALVSGGVFGLYKMRVDIPALNTAKIYAHLDSLGPRREMERVHPRSV